MKAMAEGMVFDIQHFAVHDGPGIRTLVFLKGCPLSCPWCCNPESRSFRSQLRHSAFRCRSCGACTHACPTGAARLGESGPSFDRAICHQCETWACVDACPQGALAKVGRLMTVPEVMAHIEADRAFYENSGGGATFSGGEPLAQPEFLFEVLSACRASSISTAVETCGYAPPEVLEQVASLVDHFYFDLKILDPAAHEALLGRTNGPIMDSLQFLAMTCPEKMTIRVPVVPGCTDSSDNLQGIAQLMGFLGLSRMELEPYHPFGRSKAHSFGMAGPLPPDLASPSPTHLRELALALSSTVLACTVAGE